MNIDGTTPLFSEAKMRALGFTDRVQDHWYLCTPVGPQISLDIQIDKRTGEYEEYVLDNEFLQPYPYMSLDVPVAYDVRANVDKEVSRLREHGLSVSVNHDAYRWC